MVIHFDTIEAARKHLQSKGFVEGAKGIWVKDELRATVAQLRVSNVTQLCMWSENVKANMKKEG